MLQKFNTICRLIIVGLLIFPLPVFAEDVPYEVTVNEAFEDDTYEEGLTISGGNQDVFIYCNEQSQYGTTNCALAIASGTYVFEFSEDVYEIGFIVGAVNNSYDVKYYYSDNTDETIQKSGQDNSDFSTMYDTFYKSFTDYNNDEANTDKFITKFEVTLSDLSLLDTLYWQYADIPTTTTSSSTTTSSTTSTTTTSTTTTTTSTTTTTTTTTTTLPKAEDVVEDGNTTYLAWDEYGCEHPDNPLSFKQYLEAVESGVWFGYQDGDCTDIPIDINNDVEEEEIDEEIFEEDTIQDETEDTGDKVEESEEELDPELVLTEEEIAAIEAEIKAEEERLLQEQLDAEEELLILEELEDSIIELDDLSDEEVEELVEVIKELEELEEFIIEEEIIELDIPEDIVVIIIEDDKEDEIQTEPEDILDEREDEFVALEQEEQETISEELPAEEKIAEEVEELEEIVEIPVEITGDETEEEQEEIIEEYVETLDTETKIEIVEEIADVGVENLKQVSEDVLEVVEEVVSSVVEDVEELSEEEVEVVATVLNVSSEDVIKTAEIAKEDENVAAAVDEFITRAAENADDSSQPYTLADSVVEIQTELFIADPIGAIIDIDISEINLSEIGSDMTTDQKKKSSEAVVPIIIVSQIIAAPFTRRF
jgi:hypothetical protein